MKLPGLKEKIALLKASRFQYLPVVYAIKDDKARYQFVTELTAQHAGHRSSADLLNGTFSDFNGEAASYAQEFAYYDTLCKEQRSEILVLSLLQSALGAKIGLLCSKPILDEKNKVEGVETSIHFLPSSACLEKISEGYQRLSSIHSEADTFEAHKGILTKREKECVYYLTRGLTFLEIAKKMLISARTVESHVINIKAKLGVKSRSELIVKACELGYLEIKVLGPQAKSDKLQLLSVKPCEELEDIIKE